MATLPVLSLEGEAQFRARCTLAILSGRRIRIDRIRHRSEAPGLTPCEASYLRLLDRLTNGTRIEINETGTSLRLVPGVIIGGVVEHACSPDRGIGWYLEGILPLLPFAKKATSLTLDGVTDHDRDLGVDVLRTVTLPLCFQFGLREGLAMKVVRRGCPPLGGGRIVVTCPVVRALTPINMTDEGLVRKVRGVAFSARVSPQFCNRLVDSSRSVLLKLLPDVHVHTDAARGGTSGASPGYGIVLTAFTTSGVAYSAQCTSHVPVDGAAVEDGGRAAGKPRLPEDAGVEAAERLLDEIGRGGCIDALHQPLIFTLMALCPEDVSRVRVGTLTPAAVATLRLLRLFLGVMFNLKPQAVSAAEAKAAATAAAKQAGQAGGSGGEGEDVSVGMKRRREGMGDGGDTTISEGRDATTTTRVVRDPITGLPITSTVAAPISATSILVSCVGSGHVNVAKKVS